MLATPHLYNPSPVPQQSRYPQSHFPSLSQTPRGQEGSYTQANNAWQQRTQVLPIQANAQYMPQAPQIRVQHPSVSSASATPVTAQTFSDVGMPQSNFGRTSSNYVASQPYMSNIHQRGPSNSSNDSRHSHSYSQPMKQAAQSYPTPGYDNTSFGLSADRVPPLSPSRSYHKSQLSASSDYQAPLTPNTQVTDDMESGSGNYKYDFQSRKAGEQAITNMRSQYPTHSYSHSQQIPAWSSNPGHGMLSPALSGVSGVKDFLRVANVQHNQMQQAPHGSQVFKTGSPYQHFLDDEVNSSTPKTISPKDILLEANVDDDTPLSPLFEATPAFQSRNISEASYGRSGSNTSFSMAAGFNPIVHNRLNSYPFVSDSGRTMAVTATADFGISLTRTNTSASASDYSDMSRPMNTQADRGTYSCTYHGCTERFESPQKLQRHKREGHRQSNNNGPTGETDENGNVLNTQSGVHTCFRVNPSTGKSCNLSFSRPYDLTRHEDTIHNAKKMKVRCEYCTEEKTFSRNDALTRHMRVVHPEKNYGQKRRKNAVN